MWMYPPVLWMQISEFIFFIPLNEPLCTLLPPGHLARARISKSRSSSQSSNSITCATARTNAHEIIETTMYRVL